MNIRGRLVCLGAAVAVALSSVALPAAAGCGLTAKDVEGTYKLVDGMTKYPGTMKMMDSTVVAWLKNHAADAKDCASWYYVGAGQKVVHQDWGFAQQLFVNGIELDQGSSDELAARLDSALIGASVPADDRKALFENKNAPRPALPAEMVQYFEPIVAAAENKWKDDPAVEALRARITPP